MDAKIVEFLGWLVQEGREDPRCKYRTGALLRQVPVTLRVARGDLEIFAKEGIQLVSAEYLGRVVLARRSLIALRARDALREKNRERITLLKAEEMEEMRESKRRLLPLIKAFYPETWREFDLPLGRTEDEMLQGGTTFLDYLEEHFAPELRPKSFGDIVAEGRQSLEDLRLLQDEQGLQKLEGPAATITRDQVKRFLYARLLQLSRLGQFLFAQDPAHLRLYQLSLLEQSVRSDPDSGDEQDPPPQPS